MGSWGKTALESDEGLDILDVLIEYPADRQTVHLKDLFYHYRGLGFLSEDPEEEDFLYDQTAIALAEIVCAYIENGKTKYEKLSGLKEIVWDTENLLELRQLVQQVRDNKGGDRELYELWDEDPEWLAHLDHVIRTLSQRL
ncbi:DUF4259 domain-containing protein [Paenibacillus pinihumi]|uniref:DUF4259 domain-containing protein n=1 Tax=Paenibacillus pinihumi TaxID=669462 RepID=UPI0004101BEC|nr:DUF4259 domain-containing protein [Paenibacillus pinihumi]